MKTISIMIALALLGGCTTNGTYDAKKTWTLVGVVAVGAVIASQGSDSSHKDTGPDCYIVVGDGISDQVCR